MYLVRIERTFSAAHALELRGTREPVHGHDWRVCATVAGATLDRDGLLVDFHELERSLGEIVGRFHNRHLIEVAPFDRVNPSAELVAHHVATSLQATLPEGLRVESVAIGEAPGCTAVYRPRGAEALA